MRVKSPESRIRKRSEAAANTADRSRSSTLGAEPRPPNLARTRNFAPRAPEGRGARREYQIQPRVRSRSSEQASEPKNRERSRASLIIPDLRSPISKCDPPNQRTERENPRSSKRASDLQERTGSAAVVIIPIAAADRIPI